MNIYVSSLGCDKNLCDTEHMLKLLADAGYSFTGEPEDADVILINSCCFIGDAKEESIGEILSLSRLKEAGRLKALVVTGCLAERYQDELEKELPEIDGCLGISAWDRIVYVVEDALSGRHPHVFDEKTRLCEPNAKGRLVSSGGHYAYLKIAEGCSKNCAYCVIPKVRGPYRSIPQEILLEEARTLAENGAVELILVAQETTLYGVDLYGKRMLPSLVNALSEIPGIRWVRLLYCYPEEITEELVSLIKNNEKVVPYLDMPVQHASDRILARMNRRTRKEEILSKIRLLREEVPGITLRTTLITGFPGETEEDYQELLEFVREARFDRLGVFTYSREEGTEAGSMKEQVPERIKKKRRSGVMKLQQEISREKGGSLVGRVLDVMIEGRVTAEEHLYAGRTVMDAPDVDGLIFISSGRDLMSGSFVKALVTGAEAYDLTGEIIDESAE